MIYSFVRDFSAANMIGAEGLLGKAWPDLDMLPLGWLTDPGEDLILNQLTWLLQLRRW